MQKGILIKDGTDIKAKEVYGGDVSSDTMNAVIAALQAKHPTTSIQFFDTDQDSTFISAVVNSPFPPLG